MNKNYFRLFLTSLIFLPMLVIGLTNLVHIHGFLRFFMWCLVICAIVLTAGAAWGDTSEDEQEPTYLQASRKWITYLALILIIPWKGFITTYNKSVDMSYKYKQKCEQRPGFYDAMWKTYSEKKVLTGMNEATFIKIATIIMDARKDGPQLAWKWTQENTSITFAEFTAFYKDLSSYIEIKRKEYYELEVECQQLAYAHNAMIKEFPNNVYNVVLRRPKLEYSYGFLSDSTTRVFANKKE